MARFENGKTIQLKFFPYFTCSYIPELIDVLETDILCRRPCMVHDGHDMAMFAYVVYLLKF